MRGLSLNFFVIIFFSSAAIADNGLISIKSYYGKLGSNAMTVALDKLMRKSEGIENGKMLYVINDFQLPTLGAIAIEFSRLPSMFGLIKRFNRAAVLTDKIWLKKASEFEGALIPGLEIKTFNLD